MAGGLGESPRVCYVMEINEKSILRRTEWSTLSKNVERSSKMKTEKLSIACVLMEAIGGLCGCCAAE